MDTGSSQRTANSHCMRSFPAIWKVVAVEVQAARTVQHSLPPSQRCEHFNYGCRTEQVGSYWSRDWVQRAGFIAAAFRKWLRAYRFNVGDVCLSLRSDQICDFEGCHFIKTESDKPPREQILCLAACMQTWFLPHAAGIPDLYIPTGGKFAGYTEQAETLPHCKRLP